MMRSWVCLMLAFFYAPRVVVAADRPLRAGLFDFEAGVNGWIGNPWGGGKCGAEAAGDAKFGRGSLRGWYANVEKGANVICPYLPQDADWRKVPWGGISLYLRGDGSAASLTLQLETDEKTHPTYSRSVPLEEAEWHRIFLPFSTFWNRGGQTFGSARMRRFYFGTAGTHHFFVDEIQLEAACREVPLTPVAIVAIPLHDGAPRLDGRLDDECWEHSTRLEPFVAIDGSAAAKENTVCRLCYDGKRLYVAATLETAEARPLRATLTRHDSAVYTDDSFEVFITGDDPDIAYYQFAVNPLGTTMELSSKNLLAFEHNWKAAALVVKDGWTVEASIALSPLIRHPSAGATFGLNLCRENRGTGELSCWSPTGESFLRSERFGQAILLGRAAMLPVPLPVWNDYGDGVHAARLDASSLREQVEPLTLRAALQLGKARFEGEDLARQGEHSRRELFAPVRARLEQEGEARLRFSLARGDGPPMAFYAFRYQVFLPIQEATEPSALPIVPSPKQVTAAKGQFVLPRKVLVAIAGGQPVDPRVMDLLVRETRRWYDVSADIVKPSGRAAVVILKSVKGKPAPREVTLPLRLASRLADLPTEGYILVISPSRVLMAANDDAGLYYAAQAFLQNIELNTSSPCSPRARCCTVVDWPSLRWRALTMSLPTHRWGYPNDAPVDVGFFCDFLERFIARRKFNALVFLTREGVKYDSHPEISGPAAWSKADVRRVVETCRANFIEPIPLVDSYGHAEWMSLSHKELWEDSDHSIVCTSNPATFKILTDVYAELLEVFAPVRYFHLGLDEVWWKTLDVPMEKRCKLCAGKPKWQLFADQVARLHDWLKERGVRAMMWSDVLLPEHNGGAPYHGAKALPLLPKGVLQTNWSTSLAPSSNKLLHDRGFTVWQSNSLGVNREQAQYCEGNMFGVWSKLPWWTDAPWQGGQAYSCLNFPVAAEYSWNLWPDVRTLEPPFTWAWLRQREEATLVRDSLLPEPKAAATTFVVPIPGNMSSRASEPPSPDHWFGAAADADLRNVPRGEVTIGGVRFHIGSAPLDCASPVPPGSGKVIIPVGRRAASLRFLHTASIVRGKEEALFDGFKKAANWRGIPMGAYTIIYEDGSSDVCPILYINNIKRWEVGDRLPYAFRAVGLLCAATEKMRQQDPNGRDICLYVTQWVNPHVEKVIRSIEVTGCAEALPVVFAVTGRDLNSALVARTVSAKP